MRAQFLIVASFSSTLVVAAMGLANPQAGGGVSAGASLGSDAGAAASAHAPPAAPAPGSSAGKGDIKSRTGGGPYEGSVARGHAAYVARDYLAAISAYKEAIAKDAADPLAYYFLGEAELAAGKTAEADVSFATGLRNVGAKDDVHGKLLFVVADLRERQGKWPDAKKAWEDYAQFLSTHPNVKGYAATATERVKMLDGRADLDAKYAPVRQRIEQRVKENAALPPPAPDDGPQGPPKKK